ncbi:NAD-dependent epimerase/dehydratase family protein [Taibaiella lutea]|uniref:NAD-dependent epimerase/dehydratase family protein n=1 Tax=Taibaiella lutea TaxID=2608001 RepID=A0A5M6CIK0_9BACT|nr:NAD-dependent epimerase/dehydratase family protein [Taibaiella lutea]KAA5533782.1 NAD-dependent epimerase/dehydratase family protein [Taibaiella lutea]
MTNLIVTGSNGFVGINLCPYLQVQGFNIFPLNLRQIDWAANVNMQADAIIHLAGKAHDLSNTSHADEYFKINTDLTIALFDIFLKSNARDFIYFSSVKAAADTVTDVLKENDNPSPVTPYGQSKLKAEKYLLSQKLPEGKRLFILRPCMIHGPGNKGNLNLLYKFVSRGIPYPLAAFQNRRSFLSIDNLCYVIDSILKDENIPSGIYNLADDDALSTNEVVSIIATTLHKKPRLWSISASLLNGVAKVGDVLKLPLNKERLKKLTENYIVSNQKIKDALNIKALPVSSKDGLKKTIQSFLSK